MDWHVKRIDERIVTACPGYVKGMAEEPIAGDDPELVSFLKPPPPVFVHVLYPVHLWERLSGEGEAEKVGAVMAQQDLRTRKIFESASSYRSDHELWPLLQQIAKQLFGAERAAQILAPSELVPAS